MSTQIKTKNKHLYNQPSSIFASFLQIQHQKYFSFVSKKIQFRNYQSFNNKQHENTREEQGKR